MKIGLSNVISLLHRGPGISRATHPHIYETCALQSDRVKEHLSIEGMKLLHDPALGLFSAVCRDRDEIAEECLEQGLEPFLPVWNAQALDYHSSVLAVILRMQSIGFESSEESWTNMEEVIHQFETYLPDEEKGDDVKIRDKVSGCLKTLMTLNFAEFTTLPDGKDGVRATGWLILRLTTTEVERFRDMIVEELPFVLDAEPTDSDSEENEDE